MNWWKGNATAYLWKRSYAFRKTIFFHLSIQMFNFVGKKKKFVGKFSKTERTRRRWEDREEHEEEEGEVSEEWNSFDWMN